MNAVPVRVLLAQVQRGGRGGAEFTHLLLVPIGFLETILSLTWKRLEFRKQDQQRATPFPAHLYSALTQCLL